MMMRAFGHFVRIAIVASMPLISGSLTSIRVTSVCCSLKQLIAWRPSEACATTCQPDMQVVAQASDGRQTIGLLLIKTADCLASVGSLRYYLHVRLAIDHAGNPLAHERMVINTENSDWVLHDSPDCWKHLYARHASA